MNSMGVFIIVVGVFFAFKPCIAAHEKPTSFAVKLMHRGSILAPSAQFAHTYVLSNMNSNRPAVIPDHIPIHETSRKRRALQYTPHTVKLMSKGSIFAPSAQFPHTNVLSNMNSNRPAVMPDHIPIHETSRKRRALQYTPHTVKLMSKGSIFAPSAQFPHTNVLSNMNSNRPAVMPDHIPIHETSRKRRALQYTPHTVKLMSKGSIFAPSAKFPHTNVHSNRPMVMPDHIPIHETAHNYK